jgi:4a-hydroxytetrahydrobiopterin dehydratase
MELLSDSEIESRLGELEGWEREGDAITKTFELTDFVGSVNFVQKLVQPAEDMGHHPDLSISWNKVTVSITTHAAGGLTQNDFELARRIDQIG